MEQYDRRKTDLKNLMKAFFKKMLENISSAKMLMFFLPFALSTVFMGKILSKSFAVVDKILAIGSAATTANKADIIKVVGEVMSISTTTFISWCTFTVSLASAVIICREVFKVQKLNALTDSGNGNINEIKEIGV